MTHPSLTEEQHLTNWCLGNAEAVAFLQSLGQISQELDDMIDAEDEQPVDQPLVALVARLIAELPQLPFYKRYGSVLWPLLVSSLLIWEASNAWRQDPNRTTRQFAFVYREITEQLIIFVAYLLGGWDHARTIVRAVHAFYHQGTDQETFETWESDHE